MRKSIRKRRLWVASTNLRFGVLSACKSAPHRTSRWPRVWPRRLIYELDATACSWTQPENGEGPTESLQNEAGQSAAKICGKEGGSAPGRAAKGCSGRSGGRSCCCDRA